MSGSLLALQGGGSSFTTPLFARLTAAPNVAAGTYNDTLTVQWDYSVCNGVNVLGVVCTGYDSGKVVITLQLTLVVGNDCKITAPDLSFGSAALAASEPRTVKREAEKRSARRPPHPLRASI